MLSWPEPFTWSWLCKYIKRYTNQSIIYFKIIILNAYNFAIILKTKAIVYTNEMVLIYFYSNN